MEQYKSTSDPLFTILNLKPVRNIIHATLAIRHFVLRSQYVRASSLAVRLALTALALAAVSLFALTLSAPIVFQGQVVSFQVSLVSNEDNYSPPLSASSPLPTPSAVPEADNSTKYFREYPLFMPGRGKCLALT